jgi:hypothetical protein
MLNLRMDFLMLLPGGHRVVIEVDGKHHYATGDRADPTVYAATMRGDRELRFARLCGQEGKQAWAEYPDPSATVAEAAQEPRPVRPTSHIYSIAAGEGKSSRCLPLRNTTGVDRESQGAEIELVVVPSGVRTVITVSSAYAERTLVPAGANSCRGTVENAAATSGRVIQPFAVKCSTSCCRAVSGERSSTSSFTVAPSGVGHRRVPGRAVEGSTGLGRSPVHLYRSPMVRRVVTRSRGRRGGRFCHSAE